MGDYVQDTPSQREPASGSLESSSGCPPPTHDTCPNDEGFDPVHNYMDYSSCSSEFTDGQVRRMSNAFYAFRETSDYLEEVINSDACFSLLATAIVKDKGKVSMKDVVVGDKVLTSSGQYQTVYTISHFHPTKPTTFLQIHTDPRSILNGFTGYPQLELPTIHFQKNSIRDAQTPQPR